MIYHGHFTHPELWMMWWAIFASTVSLTLELYKLWRNW